MNGVIESVYGGAWIKEVLEDDATLMAGISGVFADEIPHEIALPAVRYHVQAPHDVKGVSSNRIMCRVDYLIVVVKEGHGIASAIPLADRIDALLDEATGENDKIRVMSCTRQEPFTMLEPQTESGVRYRHLGGIYRTLLQSK